MPLTDAELAFLDAYVHELYSAPMTGPHTRHCGNWEPVSGICPGFLRPGTGESWAMAKVRSVLFTQSPCLCPGLPRRSSSPEDGSYVRN